MPVYWFIRKCFYLHSSGAFSALLKGNSLPLFIAGATSLVFLFFPLCSHASLFLTGKLNINDAAPGELLLLPHMDSVKSGAIYKYRQKEGPFRSFDALLNVKGIGRRTYEKVMPYIKLSGRSDLDIRREPEGDSHSFFHDGREGDKVLLLGNDDFFTALHGAVKKAQKSIHLSMFLFKISSYESNRANIILDALASAAGRGVSVSVLLEESNREDDFVTVENRKSAEKLKKRGVTVRFDSPKRTTHTKAVVIDSRYVFIGSHNFTHSAFRYNNELSLLIDSKVLAEKTLDYMKDIN